MKKFVFSGLPNEMDSFHCCHISFLKIAIFLGMKNFLLLNEPEDVGNRSEKSYLFFLTMDTVLGIRLTGDKDKPWE
jgi:hypothetical protein